MCKPRTVDTVIMIPNVLRQTKIERTKRTLMFFVNHAVYKFMSRIISVSKLGSVQNKHNLCVISVLMSTHDLFISQQMSSFPALCNGQ